MKRKTFLIVAICFFFCFAIEAQETQSRNEERANQLADSLYTCLSKGANFELMAKTYSEDPGSAKKGGLYADAAFGSFVAEFESVVLTLSAGEISKPFKSQYGIHIVQLLNKSTSHFSVRHILIKYS